MFVQRLDASPRNHRGGQISHLLLAKGQFGASNLAITWVEGAPGSEQLLHAHAESEQVYVIVRGRGLMRVAEESRQVGPGDLIFISPAAQHSIRNIADEPLVYVSATSPPFDPDRLAPSFRYTAPPNDD